MRPNPDIAFAGFALQEFQNALTMHNCIPMMSANGKEKMMMNKKRKTIDEEGMKRLCDFVLLLWKIDQRELVTDFAKERHARKMHPPEKGDVIDPSCVCQKHVINKSESDR